MTNFYGLIWISIGVVYTIASLWLLVDWVFG